MAQNARHRLSLHNAMWNERAAVLLSLGIKLPHVQLVGVGTSALHAVGQMGRRYAQHRMRPECGTVVAVVLPCGDQVCTQLHVRAEYGTASLTKPFAQTADGS